MEAVQPQRIGIPIVSRAVVGSTFKTAAVSTTVPPIHGCGALEITKGEVASMSRQSTASPLDGLSDNESYSSSHNVVCHPVVACAERHPFNAPVAARESVDRHSIQCATQCASRCASLCADYLFMETHAFNSPIHALSSVSCPIIEETSGLHETQEASAIFGEGTRVDAVVRSCDHVMRSKGLIDRLTALQKNFPRHHIRGEQPAQEVLNAISKVPRQTEHQLGEAALVNFRTELNQLRQEVMSMRTAKEDCDRKKRALTFNELRARSERRPFSQAAKLYKDIVGQQQHYS